eukprot:7282951-Prymnesium_polylepis.1
MDADAISGATRVTSRETLRTPSTSSATVGRKLVDPCGAAGAACCRRRRPHNTADFLTLFDAAAAQRVHAQSRRDEHWSLPWQEAMVAMPMAAKQQ